MISGKVFIAAAVICLSSLNAQAAGDKPSSPSIVDHVRARGRIYLDAAIDSDFNIHLVWMSIHLGSSSKDKEISPPFYMKGTKLGRSWSMPLDISTGGMYDLRDLSQYPRVMVAGDSVVLFWTSEGLVCKLSTDGGISWGPERLTIPGVVGSKYGLLRENGILYLVYSNRHGTFFSKSGDFGSNWAPPVLIAQPMRNTVSRSPVSLAISHGIIHVVGEADGQRRSGGSYAPGFYYIRGRDLGDNWEDPRLIDLTKDRSIPKFIAPAADLKILALGNSLLVSFLEKGLSYVTSHDGGETWSPPTALPTVPPVMQYEICALRDDGAIVFWVDLRNAERKWWAHIPLSEAFTFDADPYKDNNDVFYATIKDGAPNGTGRLTRQLSYAETYNDAIFCSSAGDSVLVIWGGKSNIGKYVFDPDEPSEIFYEVLKVK